MAIKIITKLNKLQVKLSEITENHTTEQAMKKIAAL